MSLINISHLTFAYEGSFDNIFEDVSFQIDTDWKLGFTGRNGKGKTTFLNLLLGKYEYKGSISASVGFEYFPFTVPDKSKNSLEVAQDGAGTFMLWELKRELSLLEVDEDVLYRPFGTLSSGEQTKVLLAALFLKENSFLLIDEPTNHLDMNARKLVSRYLNGKKGFILVSHDRAFLDGCIDHILSMSRTTIEIQKGNFSSWYENKARQDQFELAQNEHLKKEIKRLQSAARRTSGWSNQAEKAKHGIRIGGLRPDRGRIGHKAAKVMKRATSMEERRQTAVKEKSKLLKNIENTDSLRLNPLPYFSSRLVTLQDISILYGEKTVCGHVNFTVEQGDRIALCGKNGSGKSSLLKLVCGEEVAFSGTLQKGSGIVISRVFQDSSFLKGNLSDFAVTHNIDESLFKAILRKLDFARVQFEKDLANFSEGQKKKVQIAKSLCQKAHLYVWDEPLNFIDVFSRIQIEELLLKSRPTILFVEHDSLFTRKIATKIVTLGAGIMSD